MTRNLPKIKYDPNKGWMEDKPEPVRCPAGNRSTCCGEVFLNHTSPMIGTHLAKNPAGSLKWSR